MRTKHVATAGIVAALAVVALAGCSASDQGGTTSTGNAAKIVVVGAENEYADVAAQIGGQYVTATAILTDPTTDPHTFEANPSVAKTLSTAQLVIQNGLGYDDWMTTLLSASPSSSRKVIVAQTVLGLPNTAENPHLWYDPKTMPAVADTIERDLTAIDPSHASVYRANLATFKESMTTWTDQIAAFKQKYAGVKVAATEPVPDFLLQAAGIDIATPWALQAAIMNGTDPSPQDSATQDALFTKKAVKAFLYNQQVTSSLTSHYLDLAHQNGVPVVGVYETMPTGYTYQKWMEAELTALQKALENGTSTETLN